MGATAATRVLWSTCELFVVRDSPARAVGGLMPDFGCINGTSWPAVRAGVVPWRYCARRTRALTLARLRAFTVASARRSCAAWSMTAVRQEQSRVADA
jgi:hypothetical protein